MGTGMGIMRMGEWGIDPFCQIQRDLVKKKNRATDLEWGHP